MRTNRAGQRTDRSALRGRCVKVDDKQVMIKVKLQCIMAQLTGERRHKVVRLGGALDEEEMVGMPTVSKL